MEKKKRNIVIGVTSLLLATLILLGLTYAYYKTRIVGNTSDKSVSVVSKNLSVTYHYESAEISATGIEPGYSVTKTFEVKNTGSETVEYSVMLDNVTNTFTRTDDWTYTISESGTTLKSGTLPASTSYILYSESIDVGATKSYTLKIDYANSTEDQSDDMGASLSFRINISDSLGTTLTSASEGTLLYAINRDNVVSEPLTAPEEGLNLIYTYDDDTHSSGSISQNEAVLAPTEDDYGTSYYFRGSIDNNYVTYSNMCWRIVRVQGDGTIKLVLADREHACGTANGYDTAGAVLEGMYKYSDFVQGDYLTTFNYNKSSVAKVLIAWAGISSDRSYTYYIDYSASSASSGTFTNDALDTSKLVDAEWCVDTSINSVGSFPDGPDEVPKYSFSNKTVTLKCNMKGLNNSSATKYTNKIGMLTYDEVMFAGSSSDKYKYNEVYLTFGDEMPYYLADRGGYWLLTPIVFVYTNEYWTGMYIMGSYYSASSDIIDDRASLVDVNKIRPAIVLKSNVTISNGNGTIDNPYVIS